MSKQSIIAELRIARIDRILAAMGLLVSASVENKTDLGGNLNGTVGDESSSSCAMIYYFTTSFSLRISLELVLPNLMLTSS